MNIGIWLGFPYEVALQREGIGRFTSYLVKHMSKRSDDRFEVWCDESNRAEAQTLFKDCRNLEIYSNKHFPKAPSIARSVRVATAEITNIALRGSHTPWRAAPELFERVQVRSCRSIGLLTHALSAVSFACRAIRKAVPAHIALSNAAQFDELAEIANHTSSADVFLVPIFTLQNAVRLRTKKVLVAHDLVPLEYRSLFKADLSNAELVLKNAQEAVDAWSNASRVQFVSSSEHVRRTHVLKNIRSASESNTSRIYLPANVDRDLLEASQDRQEFERLGIRHSYIFYPTQVRPHKNLNVLLNALHELRKKSGEDVRLVLTGKLSDCRTSAETRDRLGLGGAIVELGTVTPKQLMALYRFAALTAIPTLFEGGFPWQALEAMAVGTPVVISRIPAVLERLELIGINPESSGLLLFDPQDVKGLINGMERALHHRGQVVQAQASLTERLLSYSWDDTSRQYRELLHSAAS